MLSKYRLVSEKAKKVVAAVGLEVFPVMLTYQEIVVMLSGFSKLRLTLLVAQ